MSITGQKVPFVGTVLVALTLKFRKFQQMEQYYAQKAQLPHLFPGSARQRESGFGSLAAGVGRVALSFAKKFLLSAVKSVGKEFLSQSIPELLDVASKKTPKQAVRSAVRKTVKYNWVDLKEREEANDSFGLKNLQEVGQIFFSSQKC